MATKSEHTGASRSGQTVRARLAAGVGPPNAAGSDDERVCQVGDARYFAEYSYSVIQRSLSLPLTRSSATCSAVFPLGTATRYLLPASS